MKKLLLVTMLALFTLVIAACGSDDSKDNGSKKSDSNKKENEELTIKHELGKTKVKKNPEKVAVFDFGALDSLDELGVDVAAVPQKVIPPYIDQYKDKKYENIGSLKEPDFEKLSEIAPDLIIISGRQQDQYKELSKIAPTVYLGIDAANYMDSFESNMKTLGEIFDKEDEVKEKLAKIEDQVKETKELADKSDEKALIVLANDDKISAYGSKSRFGLIHDVLDVKQADEKIEASTHGMNVSFEYVKEKNPDILYVVDRSTAIGEGEPAKDVVENKITKNTNAYKNDKIVYLDPYLWYLAGGGLQSVPDMIQEIQDSLK